MQLGDTNMNVPKSLVIHFTRNATTYMPQGFYPIVLKAPSSFPYESNKIVLWRYDAQVSEGGQGVPLVTSKSHGDSVNDCDNDDNKILYDDDINNNNNDNKN